MSDTDGEFDKPRGLKIPYFHGRRGEDYGLWRHRLRAACRVKSIWSVGEVVSPSATASSSNETTQQDSSAVDSRLKSKQERASGFILSVMGMPRSAL